MNISVRYKTDDRSRSVPKFAPLGFRPLMHTKEMHFEFLLSPDQVAPRLFLTADEALELIRPAEALEPSLLRLMQKEPSNARSGSDG